MSYLSIMDRISIAVAFKALTFFSMAAFAQEENNFKNIIADTAIPFSKNGKEIEQYLRTSLGWPSFQEGSFGALNYRFDPDGNAHFGADLNHDEDNVFKVACNGKIKNCKIQKDILSVTWSKDGALQFILKNMVVSDEIEFQPIGSKPLLTKLHYPFEQKIRKEMMRGGVIFVRRGNAQIAEILLDDIPIVIDYIYWLKRGQKSKEEFEKKNKEKLKKPIKKEMKVFNKEKIPKPIEIKFEQKHKGVLIKKEGSKAFEKPQQGVRSGDGEEPCFTLFDLGEPCVNFDPFEVRKERLEKIKLEVLEPSLLGSDEPLVENKFVPFPKKNPRSKENETTLEMPILLYIPVPKKRPVTEVQNLLKNNVNTSIEKVNKTIEPIENKNENDIAKNEINVQNALDIMEFVKQKKEVESVEKAEEKKQYIEALERLPAVQVFTDFLAEPDHLKGKFKKRITKEIRMRLLRAGIKPLEKEQPKKYPNAGRLETYFSKANKKTGCTFGVWLSLRQPMALKRNGEVQIMASTWGGGGSKREEFKTDSEFKTLMFYVDEFIKQFKLANDSSYREAHIASIENAVK